MESKLNKSNIWKNLELISVIGMLLVNSWFFCLFT